MSTLGSNPGWFITPGRSAFRRMRYSPAKPRPSSFVLRMADGTCALVVAGRVARVFVVGELPPFGAAIPREV